MQRTFKIMETNCVTVLEERNKWRFNNNLQIR